MTVTQFETLLDLYGNSIFGFCYHLTGSKASAEDLYQDAVLSAFSKLEVMDCDTENGYASAKNYILGIAVRLYRNIRRKKENVNRAYSGDDQDMLATLPDDTDIIAQTERKELRLTVRRTVASLPEKLRIVVCMFYYADMSIDSISEQLRIPPGTVKSRLSRAREQIKKELEGLDNE